jgi:predicted Zn-dependent protease
MMIRRAISPTRQWLHAVALLAALATGCAPAPAPATVFVAQADRLHDTALAQTIVANRDLDDYIQQVGQRIIDAAHQVAPDKTANAFYSTVEFHLVDSAVPNVFATGGRHIYVYAGLFQFCQSEEELAAAMSQAYAHLVNLDIEQTGVTPDEHRSVRMDVWQFASNPFSSAQDMEADRLAFLIFAQGGWDGTKFEYLYQRLNDEYHGPDQPGRASLPARASQAHALSVTATRATQRPPVADRRTFSLLRHEAAALAAAQTPPPDGALFLMALPNLLLSHETADERAAQDRLRPPAPVVPLEPN